jgi:hypothetical protein
VSLGEFMKSVSSILPPGTHHLFGKADSVGLLLQIKYFPCAFLIIPVTEMKWTLFLISSTDEISGIFCGSVILELSLISSSTKNPPETRFARQLLVKLQNLFQNSL